LVGIEPLGLRAVQPAQQGIEPLSQPLVVALGIVQAGQQFANHLLADGQVVRQRRGIGRGSRGEHRWLDALRHWFIAENSMKNRNGDKLLSLP